MKITINLPPITKKNSQQILVNKATGNPFIVPSKQYSQYERDAGWFIHKPEKPIDYPVNIKCVFYMPTERRVDLVNLLEAVDDILVKYGVLKDDNSKIVRSHDGSRVKLDREKPRTEIEILKVATFKDQILKTLFGIENDQVYFAKKYKIKRPRTEIETL